MSQNPLNWKLLVVGVAALLALGCSGGSGTEGGKAKQAQGKKAYAESDYVLAFSVNPRYAGYVIKVLNENGVPFKIEHAFLDEIKVPKEHIAKAKQLATDDAKKNGYAIQ